MDRFTIYPIGYTESCLKAVDILRHNKIHITDHPSPDVTHILLDIPGFNDDGFLRCGAGLDDILLCLPEDITIISGNIPHKYLTHSHYDLLLDEAYLWENAAVTAQCAMSLAASKLSICFRHCRVLVIGWGRIGKHLASLLLHTGANVSLLSRQEVHRAEAASFGIFPAPSGTYHVIFNTAPEAVLPRHSFDTALKIDLASKPGLFGPDVIYARGLPNKFAPDSSGALIAKTILRYLKEENK